MGLNSTFFERSKESLFNEYGRERAFAPGDSSKLSIELLSYDELINELLKTTFKRWSVVGPAGCGKSTLLKKLHRDLSKSRKFVVFLNFYNLMDNSKISPCELFFQTLNCNESSREDGYKWLVKNQKNVIFILDGLDQISLSLRSGGPHVGENSKGSTSDIISNIFSKKLFPNILVVYSSREHAVSSLDGGLRPDKMISMTGLSNENAKLLFIKDLGENGKKLWDNMSASLKPLLSIPAFLTFTKSAYKLDPNNPPSALTEIMQKLLSKFEHSEHNLKQDELTEDEKNGLRRLSYYGLKEGKLTFEKVDFTNVGLDWDKIKDLIILVPGYGGKNYRLFDGDKVAIFLHQTIQEFFAGEYIIKMDIDDFRGTVEQDLGSDRWSVITRFVAGLLLNKKSKPEDVQISELNKKQGILRNMLALKYGKGSARGGEVASKLSTLASMVETEDSDFIQSSVKNIDLARHPIGISGMSSIASVMRHCNCLEKLRLRNCGLGAEEAQLLWENIKHSQVKVDNLDVESNGQLGDGFQYICKLAAHCKVQELDATGCQLQDCQLSWLKEINPSQLKRLMISGGVMKRELMVAEKDIDELWTISDTTFASIGNSIADCSVLTLFWYIVTPSGLQTFKLALDKKKISELEFSLCPLNADCCELVGQTVKQCGVDVLMMRGCDITSNAIGRFLETVKGTKISSLDLSWTTVDADCCEVVANIVTQCSVEKLHLYECEINNDALDRFLTSAKGVKLEKLNVKWNFLSSASIKRIRESITVEDLTSLPQHFGLLIPFEELTEASSTQPLPHQQEHHDASSQSAEQHSNPTQHQLE